VTGSELELHDAGGVLPAYANLADRIARTEFVPKGLRGRPEAVLACILYGHEVGMGPMQSLSSIDVIEGKPSVKPEAMRGLVRQAGHRIWVEERSGQTVTIAGSRSGEPEQVERVTWTMDDAKAAGLASKDVWRKYPRAMLLARATSELCRSMFSDVIAGLSYTAEEVDFRDALEAGEVVEVASDEVRAELEDMVQALTPTQREKLVAWWKLAGLGSLRLDAAAPLLADHVDESWSLINEAATVADEVGDSGPPDTEGGEQGTSADGSQGNDQPGRPVTAPAPNPGDTDRHRKRVNAAMSEVGVRDDNERHALIRYATGGQAESSAGLTAEQVAQVVTVCQQVGAGFVVFRDTLDGTVELVAAESVDQ
jgi:hypothetical protein